MAKPWDEACKRLVQLDPQAFIDWVSPQPCTFIQELPHELNHITMEADGLMLVEQDGSPAIYHFEFQTYYDGKIAERLLRYNVEARDTYGLPVFSFVIHLLDDGTLPCSPLDLAMPNGQEVITFHYGSIEVSKLTPEDIWQTDKPSLLTLLPLTKKGARREIVEQMSAALHQNRNVDLEVVGQAFASLAFRTSPEDQDWLLRRFRRMHDILKDTPLMQEIIKWGREEGLKQGLKEGLKEGREEGLKEGLKEEEGLKEGLKEGSLNSSRHILLSLIEARFPSLKTQAQHLAAKIEQPKILETLILKIGLAQTAEEAQQHLLAVKIPRAKPRARGTRPSE